MNAQNASGLLEGITPETHQAFFQPRERGGIIELLGWWIGPNEHDQPCIFHHTCPFGIPGLWHFVSIRDDRLRFYRRERKRRPEFNTQLARRELITKLFGSDQD